MERTETLTEACAPVFLYLTTFRRNAATSKLTIDELHRALQLELERVRRHCDENLRLRTLFDRAFYALVAAADQVVLASSWPQRAGWSMKLLEMHYFQTSEGGKKFYRFVDEILNDTREEAADIAELLFTCMALGFQGELLGEPREIERRRRQLYQKARLPGRLGETLAPDAYGRELVRRVPRLPTAGVLRVLLVITGTAVVGFIAYFVTRKVRPDELRERIQFETRELAETQAARGASK